MSDSTNIIGENSYLFSAGFEPATLRVWSARDNHYTTKTFVINTCNFWNLDYELHSLPKISFYAIKRGCHVHNIEYP